MKWCYLELMNIENETSWLLVDDLKIWFLFLIDNSFTNNKSKIWNIC